MESQDQSLSEALFCPVIVYGNWRPKVMPATRQRVDQTDGHRPSLNQPARPGFKLDNNENLLHHGRFCITVQFTDDSTVDEVGDSKIIFIYNH